MALEGRIVTVPLDVYQRKNGQFIKSSKLHIKIKKHKIDGKKSYSLLFACQEGMYGSDLSPTKVKRCKSKKDIDDKLWVQIFECLFNDDVMAGDIEAEAHETVEIAAKLESLESYDSKTGELTDGDLADDPPTLTILIRSKGRLSIEYGSFQAQVREVDSQNIETKRELDILNWILLQSNQIIQLVKRIETSENELRKLQEDTETKDQEIKQTTDDYNTILRDLEDRFYQVLNAKRQKILELLGDNEDDIKHLNETFEVKNRTNLNRVRVEEIIKGEGFKAFEEKQQERERAPTSKKRSASGSADTAKKRRTVKKEPRRSEKKPSIKQEDEEAKLAVRDEEQPKFIKEEVYDNFEDPSVENSDSIEKDYSSEEGSIKEQSEDATDYSDNDTQVKREENTSIKDGFDSTSGTTHPVEEVDIDEEEGDTDYSD